MTLNLSIEIFPHYCKFKFNQIIYLRFITYSCIPHAVHEIKVTQIYFNSYNLIITISITYLYWFFQGTNHTVKTMMGKICVFPFIYKGISYQSCTTVDHDRLWCATTSNYDKDSKWGNCDVNEGKAYIMCIQSSQSSTFLNLVRISYLKPLQHSFVPWQLL